jgi:D-alanine-D-alanine ligase-like ATP-grasp enzyme
MGKHKKESLLLGALLKRLARKLGARVVLEPEWRIAGQITFRNGRKSYFRYNTLDLNPVGASDIAKDKGYATLFMRRMGYPTIEGKTFFSKEWAEAIRSKRNARAAYAYAKTLGFPVVVKPNSGSHGNGVFLVYDKREFDGAMRNIFKQDKVALVQRVVSGRDYRIVVLDKGVISAYERIPLNVVGDGKSTVRQLLAKKARAFGAASRDTGIDIADTRIANKLRHQKLSLRSIPRRGTRIQLLDNANLSSGGDAVDVTRTLHTGFKKFAVRLTRDMGLRMCGVDLMVEGDISDKPKKYRILEINAAPGLDHYVKQGKAQKKIVEDLYLRVLKSLAH